MSYFFPYKIKVPLESIFQRVLPPKKCHREASQLSFFRFSLSFASYEFALQVGFLILSSLVPFFKFYRESSLEG